MEYNITKGAVETKGGRMQYFCTGTGEADLVLLPGLSITGLMSAGPAVAKAYEVFTQKCRLWLFDRPDVLAEGYSIRDMARDTAEAMKELGLSQAYVIGCSMGGMIAQCLAEEYSELVKELVITNSMARPNALARRTFTRWIALAKAGNVVALNRDVQTKVYSQEYFRRFADAFKAQETVGTPEDILRFRIQAEACLHFDAYEDLAKLHCPTLVVGAWKDRVLSGQTSVALAKKLKCELYMTEYCGHATYDESPVFKNDVYQFFFYISQ